MLQRQKWEWILPQTQGREEQPWGEQCQEGFGVGVSQFQSHFPFHCSLLQHPQLSCPSISGNQGICSCLKPQLELCLSTSRLSQRCLLSVPISRVQPIKLLVQAPFAGFHFQALVFSRSAQLCHFRERST